MIYLWFTLFNVPLFFRQHLAIVFITILAGYFCFILFLIRCFLFFVLFGIWSRLAVWNLCWFLFIVIFGFNKLSFFLIIFFAVITVDVGNYFLNSFCICLFLLFFGISVIHAAGSLCFIFFISNFGFNTLFYKRIRIWIFNGHFSKQVH